MPFDAPRLTLSIALLALSAPATAQAQALCQSETRTDPLNWTYYPSRPFSGRNGFLSAGAEDIVADDEHFRDALSAAILAPKSDHDLTARARVDVSDAVAHVESYLFGYGEAGIELLLEARIDGVVKCSQSLPLYIARYNEHGTPAPGVRNLACNFTRAPGAAKFVDIKVTAHAWVTVGGLASAYSHFNATVQQISLTKCSGTCAGSCNGRSAAGCFCDDACVGFGDCCRDYAPRCDTDSCWNRCDLSSPDGSCYCDDLCTGYGDCCDDFTAACQ